MQRVSVKSNTTGITYFFDVTLRETHSFTNQITQNPVQTGAAINDHVYQQPYTFTWDVGVSDCMSTMKGASASSSASAFNVLEVMWQTADILTITTEFFTYKNMLIQSFVVTRDKTSMLAMRATVTFQEVIITDAVSISVSQKKTADPNATGQTNGGTKPTSGAGLGGSGFVGGGGGSGNGGGGVR